MKRNLHLKPRLATLVLAVAALPAEASSDCAAPAARRQTREAVRQLGLANVSVHACRAEDVPESGQHDQLIARALAPLDGILTLGGHLLRPGGRLLAMKGRVPTGEIAALPDGYRHLATHPLHVPGLDAERHLIIVEKTG